MRKDDKIVIIWVLTILLLLFMSVGFAIGATFVGKQSVFIVFHNIMSICYVLMGIFVVTSLRKYFNILSVSMIIGNCILSLGQLYFIEYRFYHRLLVSLFVLSVVYLVFYLLRFFVIRKQRLEFENIHFVNGIMPVAFVGGSFLIKVFFLLKLIKTEMDTILTPLVFIALGSAVVTLILGAAFIKKRGDKKEFLGKLAAISSITFLLVFAIPALTAEYANYAFDTSAGERVECVVIDKYTTYGGKGGPNYHLVLLADGQKVDFDIEKVVYFKYKQGDIISIYEHEGAFDYPYYAYRLDFLYQYKEE